MRIIECPRDAMQGLTQFIPTDIKVKYINQLLNVGFDTIDVGSFVSPKAIPQLRDTEEVLGRIETDKSSSSLLVIVANIRGALQASGHPAIKYLGYPLSLSETFQRRNTNTSVAGAMETVREIQEICVRTGKILVVYISMGFGNPYGDPYDVAMVTNFVSRLKELDVQIVSLADTVGVSTKDQIRFLVSTVTKEFPKMEIGVHLHSNPATAEEKINAALDAGCRRLDGALKGFGGCPMAEDELVGNIATEKIVECLDKRSIAYVLNQDALLKAIEMADELFP